MANILSFKAVRKIPGAGMHLDIATSTYIAFLLKDGGVIILKQFKNGLYFYDANSDFHETKTLLQNILYFKQLLTINRISRVKKPRERKPLENFKNTYDILSHTKIVSQII